MKHVSLALVLSLLGTEAFAQFDSPPTDSAQLRSMTNDKTGTGPLVLSHSPMLVTPMLGAATAISLDVGGGAALKAGIRSGYSETWGGTLLETHPGDLSTITWRANSSGTRTSGIWEGNSNNFMGVSARMSRSDDPPNVTRLTNEGTRAGGKMLHFASTAGVTVGDYISGSPSLPSLATVVSKTATTVEISAAATGNVANGTALSFISPYVVGTPTARGNRNTLMLYAVASDVVKPVNALMAVAHCQNVDTYCSGTNLIALSSSNSPVKLVGAEIDQVFPVGSSAASVGAGSIGIALNTFNGSSHTGQGNGPAIQLGGIDGYWSNGLLCSGVIKSGSCFGVNAGAKPIASMADSFNGTFGFAAYALGNDNGANNQRIVFRGVSGANTALYMDSNDIFHVSAPKVIDISAREVRIAGALDVGRLSVAGAASVTAVKVMRNAAGTGTCTLEFRSGLYTGGTC